MRIGEMATLFALHGYRKAGFGRGDIDHTAGAALHLCIGKRKGDGIPDLVRGKLAGVSYLKYMVVNRMCRVAAVYPSHLAQVTGANSADHHIAAHIIDHHTLVHLAMRGVLGTGKTQQGYGQQQRERDYFRCEIHSKYVQHTLCAKRP